MKKWFKITTMVVSSFGIITLCITNLIGFGMGYKIFLAMIQKMEG